MGKKLSKNKPIVILGGMGPQATGYMYNLLIDLTVKKFGASEGHTFPHILMDSIPVPEFFADEKNKSVALKMLIKEISRLNKLNILCLGIACNTAHILLPKLDKVAKKPFISMIDESVLAIKRKGIKTVGLLASPVTIQSKLYQKKLSEEGIQTIIPNTQELQKIQIIISKIIAGKTNGENKRSLISIANKLVVKGAKGILLGCTELPLIFPLKFKVPIINSLEMLSMALLIKYYQKY